MARMTRSSPWPMLTHINWLLKSRKRLPSGVQNQQPFAPATGIGSTLDCADHSNNVWALVSATISGPVMAGAAAAVSGFMAGTPGRNAYLGLGTRGSQAAQKRDLNV